MRCHRNMTFGVGILVLLFCTSGCVIDVGAASPVAERAERTLEGSVPAGNGRLVHVRNLAGAARVVAIEGTEVTVRASVVAGGDTEAEAESLADAISLRTGSEDGDAVLTVVYPVQEYSNFHYEGRHESGVASWFGGSNSRIEYLDRKVAVSTSRASGAATVHANLEIGVPRGVALRILNAVGRIDAVDVDGDLTLVVYSGGVEVSGGEGSLVVDTGSGGVDVDQRRGNVLADTGSGSVTVRGVRGEVRVDTGSGSVTVEDVQGAFVGIDTGSGSVTLRGVVAALDVDTGSGSVEGEDLVVSGRLRVDTGSGRIRLGGDFSEFQRAELDTGSGGVTLRMTGWPEMRLDLRTGSGGIDVDLPDLRTRRSDRDTFSGQVGENPSADLVISTSSGGIRVSGS